MAIERRFLADLRRSRRTAVDPKRPFSQIAESGRSTVLPPLSGHSYSQTQTFSGMRSRGALALRTLIGGSA